MSNAIAPIYANLARSRGTCAGTVAHQAAGHDKLALRVGHRQPVAQRQRRQQPLASTQVCAGADEQRASFLLDRRSEGRLQVAIGLDLDHEKPLLGGNATGFMTTGYSIGGKWLELLKEIAPSVTRAAVLRDPTQGSGTSQFAVIQAVAPSLRVEITPVGLRDTGEIEGSIAAFARSPNGGLIATAGATTLLHSNLIVTLAAQHKLPAVYNERAFIAQGGLISYGPDFVDQYRRAAGYVDRILKGEKPADLPVQAPTKYELVINLKTAKTLGLEMPATLLARADEVIE